jgi:hypothetical protein
LFSLQVFLPRFALEFSLQGCLSGFALGFFQYLRGG